jgi:rhodanese-related sulfurtransferase
MYFFNIKREYLMLIGLMSLMNLTVCAQKKVNSGVYNIMLGLVLKHNVPEISAREAFVHFDDYVFVDSREYSEFGVSHIKNAVWTGYNSFDISRIKDIPKDKKIVVYCSIGLRSEAVCNKLKTAGYLNISNMYGGIFEWVNEDYPVYNPAGNRTNKIHAYSKTWGIWLTKGEKVY